MIALHYVFNLPYAAPTQATMVFIQKLILDLDDNYTAPTKVLNSENQKKYFELTFN